MSTDLKREPCEKYNDRHTGRYGYITVFGAANIDIGGKPYKKLVARDSNPGQVRSAPGGVGRNIAHNLSLLGNQVKFISAFGDDAYAVLLLDSCKRAGIDTSESCFCAQDSTSVYLFITEEDGNMELAVNDMDIYKKLTPSFVREKSEVLADSRLVVVDANLPEDTIEAVCKLSRCPVIAESVSCSKAVKFKSVLPFIHTITGNYLEAEVLSGIKIDPDDMDSLKTAADRLLKEGAERVVITLSARGAFFADKDAAKKLLPIPAQMVNGNGAGDALLSGLITGYALDMSFEDSMMLGMAVAGITLETDKTNNPALCLGSAIKRAGIRLEQDR
ncbi:MAG: carbohydrate kinase family protein [Lachnospiraceae bacterium]|nr:carbohydrate kinase family protein [Lachnospiraceae bacterium]